MVHGTHLCTLLSVPSPVFGALAPATHGVLRDSHDMRSGLFDFYSWVKSKHVLGESMPKVLFDVMPAIWLKPGKKEELPDVPSYLCPVYKTSERRGTLSTTGHSTNFVLYVEMPTERNPGAWTEAGVAMLTTLDD